MFRVYCLLFIEIFEGDDCNDCNDYNDCNEPVKVKVKVKVAPLLGGWGALN